MAAVVAVEDAGGQRTGVTFGAVPDGEVEDGGNVEALVDAATTAAELLRWHGEEHWAGELDRDAKRIASGDFYGVEHLLSAFGGMGSLNDVRLAHRADDDRLWSLRDLIWSNARALQRAQRYAVPRCRSR